MVVSFRQLISGPTKVSPTTITLFINAMYTIHPGMFTHSETFALANSDQFLMIIYAKCTHHVVVTHSYRQLHTFKGVHVILMLSFQIYISNFIHHGCFSSVDDTYLGLLEMFVYVYC